MLSISKNANINYLAKVVQLPAPVKHPNADRMQGWIIDGNRVWTNMERQQGEVCVYFPLECVIHDKLLRAMNLYSDANQNEDPTVKGYFPKQGRVKAVKLRGEPSEGFLLPWVEVEKIMGEFYSGRDVELMNKEFDTWGDTLLVWKYVPQLNTPGSKSDSTNSRKTVKKFSKLIPDQFRLHEDTAQFKKNLEKFSPEDSISISYKLHGTSFVVGNVLTRKKLSWKEKVAKWFGINVKNQEYDLIYASRNVVKNQYINTQANGGYYNEDLWGDIKNYLAPSIQKGMTIYGECVGFTRSGRAIQKDYDYGYIIPTGDPYTEGIHFGVYIYRITQTNVDGKVIEFSTHQIAEYCEKYGLKNVPIIWTGELDYLIDNAFTPESIREEFLKVLMGNSSMGYQDVNCHMCKNKVPAEGVVVRRENLFKFEAYKLKSFKFLEKESKDLDSGEVDIETAQTEVIHE